MTNPKVKDTPSYSLGSRPKEAKKYITPAPGAYESCDTRKYKSQPPSYSLSIRYPVPSDITLKPGPGAYTREKVHLLCLITTQTLWEKLGFGNTNIPALILNPPFLAHRLTPNPISPSTALEHGIRVTCMVRGLYPEKRRDLYPTNTPPKSSTITSVHIFVSFISKAITTHYPSIVLDK